MGIDAIIYIQTKDGNEPSLESSLPDGFRIEPYRYPDGKRHGVTHEVDVGGNGRYYGEGYERGNWPMLCAAIMLLHASPDVVHVWYFGDCHDFPMPPFTVDDVLQMSAHFMTHGNRPYRTAMAKTP